MSYICNDCNYTFDEPKIYEDGHGFLTPPFEILEICPKCGGSYSEIYKCDICGSDIIDEFLYLDDENGIPKHRVCRTCFRRGSD